MQYAQSALDLGKVAHVARTHLNGQDLGRLMYAPYKLEITDFLNEGNNQLSIEVKTAQINSFIGRGKNGDKS